jgi:hypothetical protein
MVGECVIFERPQDFSVMCRPRFDGHTVRESRVEWWIDCSGKFTEPPNWDEARSLEKGSSICVGFEAVSTDESVTSAM